MLKTLRYLGPPTLIGLLLAVALMLLFPQWLGPTAPGLELRRGSPYSGLGSGPVSYAEAVEQAAPAVASLQTTRLANPPGSASAAEPSAPLFGNEAPESPRRQSSLGSAVILSPQGYLLTNNHVIAGAEQIQVTLADGRKTLARVIGNDPETDLAVLKIDLGELPVITLGHSERVRTGDVTLAIGNPFGVGQTVTMGIISATGRNQLGLNTYEDFIQTDAAINPGNSGGALIDARGQLIGINTAIFSRSGGSQGIGFAIPTQLALEVMQAIIEHGQVIRGWLGLEVQGIGVARARRLGLPERSIMVAGIYRDSPALKAGLKPGDILLSLDGQPVTDGPQAMNQVARKRPGQVVPIEVLRGAERLALQIVVGRRPAPATAKPAS
ncbi:trypsin-like peptidase domain-containing protein [Pseudomonas sp. NW5]|uniref:S1C family serine protease n=1 Tax=Pseudomonas sp. NW5 TaxID=2934934 RepID=UPI002020A394|nr:trypsin-like peptidase domain-containing protein [Pseudomonas sp. NW5]MCL7461493.1 trypsin-like peptidase domain-containing protein [Pseudomonas sp. NW5]